MSIILKKGYSVLDKKYWDLWNEVVSIGDSDTSGELDLEHCLYIIEKLNNNCSYDMAKAILNSKQLSVVSHTLVLGIVSVLCDRGREFKKFIDTGKTDKIKSGKTDKVIDEPYCLYDSDDWMVRKKPDGTVEVTSFHSGHWNGSLTLDVIGGKIHVVLEE